MSTRKQGLQRLLIVSSVLLILIGIFIPNHRIAQIILLGLAILGPIGWLWLDRKK